MSYIYIRFREVESLGFICRSLCVGLLDLYMCKVSLSPVVPLIVTLFCRLNVPEPYNFRLRHP